MCFFIGDAEPIDRLLGDVVEQVEPSSTLVPAWADTHSYTHTYTRTATCRALGSIGVRTDVPTLTLTLTDTPLSNKTVRNPPL